MKFDLLSIDLDGTLLTPILAKVSKKDAISIQKYMSQGGKICINTGRAAFSACNFINQINSFGPNKIQFLSAYNGAYIYDFIDDKFYCKTIPHKIVKQIYDIVLKHKSFIWIHSIDAEKNKTIETNKLTFSSFIWMFRSLKLVKITNFDNFEAYKVNIYAPFSKRFKQIVEDCKKLKLDVETIFCFSGKRIIEISPFNTDKGKALNFLAQKHYISKEKILSLGDSFNDKSAFDVSGHCIGVRPKQISFHDYCDTIIKHKRHAITKAINDILSLEQKRNQ